MLWQAAHDSVVDHDGSRALPDAITTAHSMDNTNRASLPQFWQTTTLSAGWWVLDAGAGSWLVPALERSRWPTGSVQIS